MSSPGKEFVVGMSILEFKDKSPINAISILKCCYISQFQKDLCILTFYLGSPVINPQNSLL